MTPCDEPRATGPAPGTESRWGETPAASLAFWLVMAVLGYAYVAAVLTDRANPLASPPGNAYELPKLLAAATVMWLLGARKTLRPFAAPWDRAALWNGLLWAVPFFIALHYEYLGGLVGSNFSLTPRDLARMNAHDWTVFAAGAALILSLVGYHGWLAWRERILGWYSRPSNTALPRAGLQAANAYGIHDLHGLVWEWTDDYSSMLVDADARNQGDPDNARFCGAGALSMDDRDNYAVLMRVAMLSALDGVDATANLGFRCARSVP